MLNTFKKVFSKIRYTSIAVLISSVVFTFAVWLSNFELISEVLFNSSISILDKLSLMFSFLFSIQTNFTLISASYTVAIAILFGINVSLLIYYIHGRQAKDFGSSASLSIGGLVSGVFGIGCAACGTFILTSVLGLFGAGSLLVILPFGGEEFGILGVGLLAYSSYLILKKIEDPLVCEV